MEIFFVRPFWPPGARKRVNEAESETTKLFMGRV